MRYKALVSRKLDELNNILLGLSSLLSHNPTREQIENQIEKHKSKLEEIQTAQLSIKGTQIVQMQREVAFREKHLVTNQDFLASMEKLDAEGGVAFSMFPVTLGQLMDISDAGQIMPPKSTWFEPKLRSGLFIHTF